MSRAIALCFASWLVLSAGASAAESAAEEASQSLPAGAIVRLGQPRLAVVGEVKRIDFSPDGRTLVATLGNRIGRDDELRVLDLRTGQPLHSPILLANPASLVQFSHDGKRLWAGDLSFDTSTWTSELIWTNHHLVAQSRNDEWCVVSGAMRSRVTFWNLWKDAAAAQISDLPADARPSAVRLSSDGKTTAIALVEGPIQVRETATGKLLCEIPLSEKQTAHIIEFSPDGKQIATAVYELEGVQVFEVASGRRAFVCRDNELRGVSVVRFSPDGKWLAAGVRDAGVVRFWNTATGEPAEPLLVGDVTGVSSLAFARDGKALAVGGRSRGNGLFVANWPARQPLFSQRGPRTQICTMVYSPDSRQLATGCVGEQVHLWDARTGALQLEVSANCRAGLAFSPDGWALGAAGQAGEYHLWTTDTGDDLIERHPESLPFRATSAGLSPQLDEIAVSRDDGQIRLMDVATGGERRKFSAFPQGLERCGLAYSPDGKLIATCEGERMTQFARANPTPKRDAVDLWDAATGMKIKSLVSAVISDPDEAHDFSRLEFSPDGSSLAAWHGLGAVIVWDLASSRQVFEFSEGLGPFCYSSDGRLIFYVEDGAAKALELASGRVCISRQVAATSAADPNRLRPVRNANNGVSALAVAPDGKTFAAANADDNTVLIWPLAPVGWQPPEPGRVWTDEEFERWWARLREPDGEAAYEAVWQLGAAGDLAMKFIQSHFISANPSPDDAKMVAELIADLDSDVGETRERATNELMSLGMIAEGQLREALKKPPSLESKTRIEHLLAALDSPVQRMGGEALRRIRAVWVLERIDTKQARQFLETLAAGSPTARETRDAKAALERRRIRAKGR